MPSEIRCGRNEKSPVKSVIRIPSPNASRYANASKKSNTKPMSL